MKPWVQSLALQKKMLFKKKNEPNMVVHTTHGRLKQENLQFEVSLDYIVKSCLRKPKNQILKIKMSNNNKMTWGIAQW
jgi:hypothetical protein